MAKRIELTCESLDFQGLGVCKKDGIIYFIENMLPTEKAEVVITRNKKNIAFGYVEKHIIKSAYRVSDKPLSYAPLNILSCEKQILFQEDITKETIKKIAGLDVILNETIYTNHISHYRNKITLHVRKINERLYCGVFESGTNTLIKIEEHLLADKPINKIIKKLNQLFDDNHLTDDTLKNITIRNSGKDVMIIYTTTKRSWKEKEIFLSNIDASSIYQNINVDEYENLGEMNIHLKGEPYITTSLLDLNFHLYPQTFFQVNPYVAEKLFERLKEEVTNKIVLDAYSGAATIGQIVSSKASSVISVEKNLDAHKSAKESVYNNKIKNITLINADINEVMHELEFDIAIFDPPQSGIYKSTIHKLIEKRPEKIIYVSCNLRTLSRDITLLKEFYKIDSLTPVRMFPQTTTNETLLVLLRKP